MRTKQKTTTAAPRRRAVSEAQVVDMLLALPEISEAYTRADIELALDDRGWERLGGIRNLVEPDGVAREALLQRCRLYYMRDPLAKQAVRLWTDYALGTGMTYKAQDDTAVQNKLAAFVEHRRNSAIMGAQGQQRSSKKLLTDGELFLAVYGIESGADVPQIRYLDPIQITSFITDPDDIERVLAYRRMTAKNQVLFYKDWRNTPEDDALAEQQRDPEQKSRPVKLEADIVVRYVPFDQCYGQRAYSLLIAAIDWTREHRRFMECRVSITQSLAKFAHKLTVKGGQATVDAIRKKIESSLVTNSASTLERNPKPNSGSTHISNEGALLEAMPRTTGASDAKGDSDSLKLMVSAATNIMLHYFGDPGTTNLATATAMELPMLKSFQGYQRLWQDVWRDIFSIVLGDDPEGERTPIDVDTPPILSEDLQKLGAYVSSVATVFPEIKVPEILQMLLTAMGVEDIDTVMAEIEKKREELDANQAEQQQLVAQVAAAGRNPKLLKQSVEAMQQLAESFRGMSTRLR